MNKMREEFEVWYWNCLYSDLDVSSKCVIFSTVSDGSYRGLECNTAWKSWKASRAALCVELPPRMNGPDSDAYACGFDNALYVVEIKMEVAGVKYK